MVCWYDLSRSNVISTSLSRTLSTGRVRDAVLAASQRALSIQLKQCERTQRQETRSRVEQDLHLTKVREDMMKEQKALAEVCTQHKENSERFEQVKSRLKQDSILQSKRAKMYETEYLRLTEELSNEIRSCRIANEKSQDMYDENQAQAYRIESESLGLQLEREKSRCAEIEIASLRSRVEAQDIDSQRNEMEIAELRKDSRHLDELRSVLSANLRNAKKLRETQKPKKLQAHYTWSLS